MFSSGIKRGPFSPEEDFGTAPAKIPRIDEPKRGIYGFRFVLHLHLRIPIGIFFF